MRRPDESAQDWYELATREHFKAQAELVGHRKRLGLGEATSTVPDQPYPLVQDGDYDAAHERVGKAAADMMAAGRLAELAASRPGKDARAGAPAD
jgi:hypothetical protein